MKYLFLMFVLCLFATEIDAQDLRPRKSADGRWGFQDDNGMWVIPATYDDANTFSMGLASAQRNGRYGYIDVNNRVIVDFQYDYAYTLNEIGVAYVVQRGRKMKISVPIVSSHRAVMPKAVIPTYSTFARQYVESRINEWQQKGRYEKTADWQERVNVATRNAMIEKLTQDAEKSYISQNSHLVSLSLSIKDYDADNEVFLIGSSYGQLLVPVPLTQARDFEAMWGRSTKKAEYFIDNNNLSLSEVKFTLPTGVVYTYSNRALLNYTVTKVDYHFDPIEIPAPITPIIPSGNQIITQTSISVGKSDVDIDIPQTATVNDKTFAVIISNEHYTKLAHVPYAVNDGKIFGEYCNKTLGLPKSNIRFYSDATYGTMLEAMSDIRRIAASYQTGIRVLFYYAGHGAPSESKQEAYLLPIDAYGVQSEVGYPLARLYKELGALNASSVTVFLDACFSGTGRDNKMLASARGVAIKPKIETPMGNLIVFSAASDDETALPYEEKGHGLFTYFLLRKLQETKGQVTYGELGDYLTINVQQKSNVVNRKSQTPTVVSGAAVRNGWKTMTLHP